MFKTVFIFWLVSTACLLAPGAHGKSSFSEVSSLYREVALIGDDDRKIRELDDLTEAYSVPDDIEKAQARIYCYDRPFKKEKLEVADLQSKDAFVANATLAFQGDVAIVNRHIFLNEDGTDFLKVNNCYLEHIRSGKVIALTDVEYPKYNGDATTYRHQDVALVKLKSIPEKSSFIKADDIIVDEEKDLSKPIKVVSNFALNNTKGRSKYTLTMTNCFRKGQYDLSNGELSNSFGTDCDTGEGSSGGQAYLMKNGRPKLFGIVSGQGVKLPEGSAFDAEKLSTLVVGFDRSLFSSYDRLVSR